MKIRKVYEKMARYAKDLCCPLCGTAVRLQEPGSLVCSTGHCFDLSAKGYVNFVPNHRETFYDKALFESRRMVFAQGWYEPVLAAMGAAIGRARVDHPLCVLDAGCGEGYYAAGLMALPGLAGRCRMFGMDIAKDAVAMACRRDSAPCWMAADLSHIPMRSGAVDVLLNILSPANYGEFSRVLSEGGILIKVVPGARYLSEVRACVGGRLASGDSAGSQAAEHLLSHMHLIERTEVCRTFPVPSDLRTHLLRMTPMTQGVDLTQADVKGLTEITIHLELLIAGKK